MSLQQLYYRFRRWALATFVPEAFWPRSVEIDGVTVKLRNAPYSFGTKWVIRNGTYEKPERDLLRRIVKPGMHVLELGGSIGIVTSVLARLVGPHGRVVSVEASPDLISYSSSWLGSPGRVDIVIGYAFPVWSLPPGLRIGGFNADCSLGGTVNFAVESGAASETVRQGEPEAFDLATLCRRFDLHPEILVADVEGSEAIVLSQRPALPPSMRYVCIELHPWLYPNKEQDERAIADVFVKDGFRLAEKAHHAWLFERA
jgi:FkbM family methyltransferase